MSSQATLPVSEMEKVEQLQIFQSPQCLIKSDTDGELSVVEETMSQLEEISFGVNVVAIAGLYRTGKSYLMNRLAHVSSGFALGNTTESKTKGIWLWCKRHPTQSNQVLVLLDTEGLGDVKKGDITHDNKIFTLAVLLSSTLVYNMMGAFNQDAVEKLTFITEMSKNMKFANGMSGDNSFDFVLPRFVLCLRDFYLELPSTDGRKMTPDEYLEDCLQSKKVQTKEDEKYNRPRECIRQYFPRRRVFTFDRPGGKKVMTRLDSVHDDELEEDFVKDTVRFTSYIFQCEPKMLLNRQRVSGSMLAKLAREYVKSMREGGVPCVEDAMTTMARKENENRVKKAVSDFKKEMGGVQLPIYNRKELLEINFSIQKMILTSLVKDLVFDDNDEAKNSAENQMDGIAYLYEQKNDEQLHKICTEKIEDYYKPIAEKIRNNKYNGPRGYQIYKKDMSKLKDKYSEELQHVDQCVRMEVLKSFQYKILANDKLLTEKEELRERDAIADQKLKESQDLILKELEKQKLDYEEKMRRITEEQRQKEEANTKMLKRFSPNSCLEELRERDAKADQKLKESQDLILKELEKQKLDYEEKMRRITEEQRQKEEANTKMLMNAILEVRKELRERDAIVDQKLKESQDLILKELEKKKLDYEGKMRRKTKEQRQKEEANTKMLKRFSPNSCLEELRERDAIADQKLKESQDLLLKELEKQRLDHEEKMRRIREEQRQKEEANTKMHMNAILEARSQEQAFFYELRRQHERFQAESRRGIFVKAWDFFFGT